MSKNTIQVTDGGAAPPVELRRLFQLEKEMDPAAVTVDRKAKVKSTATRVVLALPDNGSERESGPGIYPTGRVTLIVHQRGCPWPRFECAGGADCARVMVASDLSLPELEGRIEDLAYFFRTRERGEAVDDAAVPAREAELETLRAELAARAAAAAAADDQAAETEAGGA